jgi:uncharacterized protein YggE
LEEDMKNKYFLSIAALTLILIVATACAPITAAAQSPAVTPGVTRSITAQGEGKVYVTPDIAYIYIGVHTQSDSVASALSDNNAQAQAVSSTLKELKVDPKDIQTSAFNVNPQQQFDKDGQPTKTVYVVDNTINVTVRDLSQLGSILDAVVKSGANTINGISFDVQDKATAIAKARNLAIQDGRSQATDMASAAGVTLGDLQSLNVYSSSGPVPVYEGKGGANAVSVAPNVPTASGQMVITMEASMVYAIK